MEIKREYSRLFYCTSYWKDNCYSRVHFDVTWFKMDKIMGKQYKVVNKPRVFIGLTLFILGVGFILCQAIIRQYLTNISTP